MDTMTLSKVIQDYFELKKQTTHTKESPQNINARLRDFYAPVIDMEINEITPAILRMLFTGSKEQVLPGLDEKFLYFDSYLHPISMRLIREHQMFWNWAVEKYKLVHPMQIATEEDLRAALKPLSENEIGECLENCKYLFDEKHERYGRNPNGLRDKGLFLFLLETGQEIERIIELKIRDIDFEKSVFNRRRNDFENLPIPLSAQLIQIITEYLEQRHINIKTCGYQYLFSNDDGSHLQYRYIEHLLKNILGSLDIVYSLQRIRKTFALSHLSKTKSSKVLELCNPKKLYTADEIKRFYGLTDDEIREAFKKFDKGHSQN